MQTSGLNAPHAGAGATTTQPASSAAMSLAELVDRYMRAYAGRDHTRPSILAWWLGELGGAREAFAVTDDDIFRALERLRREPSRIYIGQDEHDRPQFRYRREPKKPATVNRYHAALMALYTFAIRSRLAPRAFENPARRIPRTTEKNQVVRFLSTDELARLLEACRQSPAPRLYLLVMMAITTGARRSELLGLTWGRVDLERQVAYVHATKNDQPKTLALTPPVVAELARFRREQLEHRVFPSRWKPTEAWQFNSTWRAVLAAAAIKRLRFHDLRHTCASYLAQNGASLLEIADVMGHRQLAMVKRYAHLTTDSKAKLVNRVLGGIK